MNAAIIIPVSGLTSIIIKITDIKAIKPVIPDVSAVFKYFHTFCCHIPIISITAAVGIGVLAIVSLRHIIISTPNTALEIAEIIFEEKLPSFFTVGQGATEPVSDDAKIKAPDSSEFFFSAGFAFTVNLYSIINSKEKPHKMLPNAFILLSEKNTGV